MVKFVSRVNPIRISDTSPQLSHLAELLSIAPICVKEAKDYLMFLQSAAKAVPVAAPLAERLVNPATPHFMGMTHSMIVNGLQVVPNWTTQLLCLSEKQFLSLITLIQTQLISILFQRNQTEERSSHAPEGHC